MMLRSLGGCHACQTYRMLTIKTCIRTYSLRTFRIYRSFFSEMRRWRTRGDGARAIFAPV